MPNWCANRVTVYGEKEGIQQFKEFVKSEYEAFSFDSILPIPRELQEIQSPVTIVDTEAEVEDYIEKHIGDPPFLTGHPITKRTQDIFLMDYGYDNWYDWSCNNWGVKWDVRDVGLEAYDAFGELKYTFDTPWGPPEPIYKILQEKFPELQIEWFWDEPGVQRAGYL